MTANKPETWNRTYLLALWKVQVKEIDRIAAVAAAQMVEIQKLKARIRELEEAAEDAGLDAKEAVARADAWGGDV